MKFTFGLIFGMMVFLGCSGDDDSDGDTITLPSNLTFEITVADDGSGTVDVVASATNANFYTVNFGASGTGNIVQTTGGNASFTYVESGTYTITVRAHATNAKYISDTEQVEVDVNDGGGGGFIPSSGYSTPESYAGMTLVWQDEFSGTQLNTADWTYETGGHGFGNNELQYYRQENTSIVDGHLVITAKAESFGGKEYTSSRLITKGKREFKYGRIDIRAALPKGQGIWPALWMLGGNIDAAPWPKCGELDIMEMIGGQNREKTVFGTLHWEDNGQHACTCDKPGYTLASGIFNDKFHVFSVTWNATEIKWYVDDVLFNTINITPEGLSEFHNEYFFIFNVAVGGNWPGSPDGTTVFPQRMIVDYVRVFQPQ